MGGDITISNERIEGGEPVADLICRSSQLKAITVPASRAASMIDEYPVLSVVAAFAKGQTVMKGVKELRVKESDRIDAMAQGLRAAGVEVDEGPDWWTVTGAGFGNVEGGITAQSRLDHRIALRAVRVAAVIDVGELPVRLLVVLGLLLHLPHHEQNNVVPHSKMKRTHLLLSYCCVLVLVRTVAVVLQCLLDVLDEPAHQDGGASVLHMSATLFGQRRLRAEQGDDLPGSSAITTLRVQYCLRNSQQSRM